MSSNSNLWNKWLSDPLIQAFIEKNEKADTSDLAFKLSKFPMEKRSFVLDQIKGRNKAKMKFDHLIGHQNIIYPPRISLEQSSSSATGRYKATLIKGNRIVDLTAGFGVDAYFFSKVFREIDLVEKSTSLLKTTSHNFKSLGITNAQFHNTDALSYLDMLKDKVDTIYLDPSRRSSSERLLDIRDYDPNLLEILALLNKKANQVLIKLSPVTDLHQLIKLIPDISDITVLSVKNECKEILVQISKEKKFNDIIHCVDLNNDKQRSYSFNIKTEQERAIRIDEIKTYIYLPMVAVSKAGAFKSLSIDFNLGKISGNTHIYTSDNELIEFPGRIFKCIAVLPFNKKALTNQFKEDNFSIICRNFPLKPAEVARKLGILDFGERYIIAFRDGNEKNLMIIAELLPLNK